MGFAIYQAQLAHRYREAKPLRGVGSGVLEVMSRHDGATFRAVYTVRFETAVQVPPRAFQKKAPGTSRHQCLGSTSSATVSLPPSGTTVTLIVD